MKDPRKIIAFGLGFFFLALFDVYIHEKDSGVQVVNIWPVMSWIGKACTVGFCLCLIWLFASQLIDKKN